MSDIPGQTKPDESDDSKRAGRIQSIVGFSVFTGVISIITSCVALLLDLASGKYGGVRPIVFICLALPSGFFGMLGGFAWQKIRRISKFEIVDLILLALIGFVAGIIPFACIKSLPQ